MKYLLPIIVLIGLTYGLQAPLQYKYKYFGSIATGIPELSSQASGWAIKADVVVFIEKNDGTAVFQLENVKTVEFNDILGCDSRGDIPDELFRSIEDAELSNALQAPFKVNLFKDEAFAIEYVQDKFRWLINLRKGIASIFRNEILKGNIEHQIENSIASILHSGHVINVFSTEEETMFGKCSVEYTIHPIPEYLAGTKNNKLRAYMKKDVQRVKFESSDYTSKTTKKTPKKYSSKTSKTSSKTSSKTASKYVDSSVPELKNDLWRVVRSVNFDKCDDIVALQVRAFVQEDANGGQFQWRRGRSSVSEYIFRGSPGNVRLEWAVVEGATTFSPLGFKTELLQARVNQTLHLVSVKTFGEVPTLPDSVQHSNTWMQEVWSFAKPPMESKPHPWVVYTGESYNIGLFQTYGVDYITPEQIDEIKATIIEKIKTASLILTDLEQEGVEDNTDSTVELIQQASFLFKFLSEKKALEIFDEFFERDLYQSDILAKKLVIDAAAGSGFHSAIDAVMSYIEQEKIPDLQIMTVFMTISGNAQCSGPIMRMMDYVLSLDVKQKPFLTSTTLINLAHFISEMCIYPNARNNKFAGRTFGDFGCGAHKFKDRINSHVMKLINDEEDYVKAIGIRTMATFRTPFIFQAVAPIIEGKVKCSKKLRIFAINALDHWHLYMLSYLKEPIVDLLTDVYSDIGEKPEVREAALTIVGSWLPDASFWHTLARSSWREPSRRFASFITSMIEDYSKANHPYILKQTQAASHAIKYAKPIAPTIFYPYNSNLVSNSINKHITNIYSTSWSTSKSFSDINQFSLFLINELGGLEVMLTEFRTMIEGLGYVKQKLSKFKEMEFTAEGIAGRIAKDFYNRIEETIKTKIEDSKEDISADIFLRFINHLHLYLPLNEKTISTLSIADSTSLAAFIVQLSMGYDLVLGKYFMPIDSTLTYATELGLPLFVSYSTPIVATEVSYSSLGFGGQTPSIEGVKKVEITSESLASISSQYHSSLYVLLPWNQKLAGAGVRSERDIILPLKTSILKDQKEDGGHQEFFDFDFQSQYKNKFTVVKASNTPYTGIIPILPLKSSAEPVYTIITKLKPMTQSFKIPYKYTGLDLELAFSSESSFPFSLLSAENIFSSATSGIAVPILFYSFASPTAKYWHANLAFNPATSKTKTISFEFMSGTFGKGEPEALTQETGDQFYQYGQENFEQYDQEQSFDFQGEFQDIGGTQEAETLHHVNYGDSLTQRSQKLQNHFGGTVKTKSFKLDFEGDEHRSYEILYSFTKSKLSEARKIKKSQISILRGPIPEVDSKPASVCIDIQKSLQIFSELDTVETLLSGDLNKDIKAELTLGCIGEPVFTAKASYQVSDAWKAKYRKGLQESCDYDPSDPLYSFKQHAVYDKLKFTYTWKKVCDLEHFPVTTKIFNFAQKYLNPGFITTCDESDHERKIEVDAYRCPMHGTWFYNAKRGNSVFDFQNIPHDNLYNMFFGVWDKALEFHPEHYSTFNLQSDKCIIGVDSIRTFDGLVYEYEASQCWTVAAKDCINNDKMLLVRSSSGELTLPEAKYIDIRRGLVIEFSKQTLKINGKVVDPIEEQETIKDDAGKTLVVVHKKNNYYKAQFSKNFYVTFKETIDISVDFLMWGHTCGLCGNSDGEPEPEYIGPHRCVYSDPNLFAASWTAGSDACDIYTLLELRANAEEFQKTCKTIDSFDKSCPYFNPRCISYAWEVFADGDNICVSDGPLPSCESTCQITTYTTENVPFRCWPKENAPLVMKDAIANNENTISLPTLTEHHFKIYQPRSLPTICKQY